MSEQIIKAEFSEVMQKSYIDYAMSVICSRALPDARDGLKPVQRRVLYAMNELGLRYDRPHRKSARIVGDTMGKYHPHGDSSIYESLVVMSQDFKKGLPLVDGHGNFGSIEGDGAAAMRYTEARLQKITQEAYLADLDKNVVDFVSNFDETEKEPEVLPVKIPNLLINGADGIAVGMTTSIPPHNLGEVVDAVKAYMKKESITNEELMEYLPGPDFPTGGLVVNKKELLDIYSSGTGKLKLRGKIVFEPGKKRGEKDKLVITEIPYTMIGNNISKFLSDVVSLIETKKTTDIIDISNESSKDGIRIVLELKKGTDIERLKNLLYKKTKLEDTFGVNMLAIVDGKPETLSLRDIIVHHTEFHYEVNRRKYLTLLNKLYEQREIKEGLIKACDMIDLIIEIIRGSQNQKEVKACLTKGDTGNIRFKSSDSMIEATKLKFTDKQATAILDLKLYRLIGLEILALQEEYKEILAKIEEYEDILENPASMKKVIRKELDAIKKEFSRPRKTLIENGKEAVYVEAPLKEEQIYFVMDRFGYSKTFDKATYERNKENVVKDYKYIVPCMNTDKICFFTNQGTMHQIKALDIPAGKYRDKGTPIDNLGNYDSSKESIVTVIAAENIIHEKLLFATAKSMLKIVDGSEFKVTKRTVTATKLSEDELIAVVPVAAADPEEKIVLQTKEGIFLKFLLNEIPTKKKGALGVRGMKLLQDDEITNIYVMGIENINSIIYKKKKLEFNKLKLAKRDTKGSKIRR
ncbi:MAG: DNA topoisomerase (ATP-hydrolyzing) [Anaerostipes faecalis]|nr:DNA topoisomerase (ATP-hydrolyzing) [Anaerostipes faecalis]